MRMALVLAVFLTAFITLGIIVERRMSADSRQMLAILARIERDVERGRAESAKNLLDRLDSRWTGAEKMWALITDHQEMDQVRLAIDRADEFLGAGVLPQARAELASLRFLIEHIPKKENVSLRSIL